MIVLIDNYDSFTFNLAQYMMMCGADVQVYRNDRITAQELSGLQPAGIVLSPGPCTPNEAGVSLNVVRELGSSVPILGVCLGHQTIGQAFGADVARAPQCVHGKVSRVYRDGLSPLYVGVPKDFLATRYHSLIVREESLPTELRVTARTEDGLVMSMEHIRLPIYGVQFHPEAILTEYGLRVVANFLVIAGEISDASLTFETPELYEVQAQ